MFQNHPFQCKFTNDDSGCVIVLEWAVFFVCRFCLFLLRLVFWFIIISLLAFFLKNAQQLWYSTTINLRRLFLRTFCFGHCHGDMICKSHQQRERERDRQTDRQRQREAEAERDRERETERQTDRDETQRDRDRETEERQRQTDREQSRITQQRDRRDRHILLAKPILSI